MNKTVCENKDLWGVAMPSEDNKVLGFNQYQTSDKIPSIIYADVESLIKKVDGCKNNPEKLSTRKIGQNIPCGYSMSNIWTFDGIENMHEVCRGENCMKNFCASLRENVMKIINFDKKKHNTINKQRV